MHRHKSHGHHTRIHQKGSIPTNEGQTRVERHKSSGPSPKISSLSVGATSDRIGFAFLLNSTFTIIEIGGAYYTGSVAVLADALHDFGDSASLAVAWYLEKQSKKKASSKFTYGLKRLSLLGAFVSGAVIISGSVYIVFNSLERLFLPPEPQTHINPLGMIGLALFGILVNGLAMLRMSGGRTQNEKVLTWHLFEDVLGWIAVFVCALVMTWTKWYWLDPLLALGIAIYISFNVVRLTSESVQIFLQGTPIGFSEKLLREKLKHIPEILGVHEIHAWSLDGETNILSLHINLPPDIGPSRAFEIKTEVRRCINLIGSFHSTIEIEFGSDQCPDPCEQVP